jgi:hypothetical protein
VLLSARDVDPLVKAFAQDFYIDADLARTAIVDERLFNVMHLESGIKVDFIVRKSSEYREVEFDRRRSVTIGNKKTWIVSIEDLILSKLIWALDTKSEMQQRDIRLLLAESVDMNYVGSWAPRLGVATLLAELMP